MSRTTLASVWSISPGDGGPVRVRATSDLKTAKEKSDFIDKHGYDAFAKLPLNAR